MHHCGPRAQNLQVPEGQSVFKRHFVLFHGDVNATSSVSTCAFAPRNLLSVVSNWVILMQVRLRHRRWVPRLFKARNISLLDSRSDQRQITLGSFICSLHGSCLQRLFKEFLKMKRSLVFFPQWMKVLVNGKEQWILCKSSLYLPVNSLYRRHK